jgi:hypothetical protein
MWVSFNCMIDTTAETTKYPAQGSRELQEECYLALDELTASLTQVLKAVRKVHKTMEKLVSSDDDVRDIRA